MKYNDIKSLRDLVKALELTPDEFLDRAIPTGVTVSQDVQEKLKTFRCSGMNKGYPELYRASSTMTVTLEITKSYPPEFYEDD